MIRFLLLFYILCAKCANCANILYVSHILSPSHHIWNRAFAFGLASKGHNVTLIGPNKDKVNPSNYSHIQTEGLYEAFHESVDMLEMADNGPLQTITQFVDFCLVVCHQGLQTRGLQQLLNYPPDFKFDLIIFDATAGGCFYPLIHRFNYPPTIAVTPFLLPSYLSYNFGNHLHPAYLPWYGLPYTSEMSFLQRVSNHIFTYMETAFKNLQQKKLEEEAAKTVFGDGTPSMEKLERHISLLLANFDPLLNYPQVLTPNIIPVGGLHTRRGKEIPKDMEAILKSAKNGVVVFSLGSNVRSDMLDKKKQKSLVEAFSKLSETVIWKFESDLENLPKNVIIRQWLPQNDILGHPNVKLFIGHGGGLSTQEAIYHGVPMICVPFFFDQHVNTRDIINRKLGISLDWRKITTEYVYRKIRKVLDNPTYTTNMKRVSKIYRDQTETPLERAIFWAEYVMRHDGAEFLNTPARDLPFYRSSGLDVLGFCVVICVVVFLVLFKLLKFVVYLFGSGQKLKTN